MSNQDFEFNDGDLTAGEKAYLESGGENATGLLSENAGAAGGAPLAPDPAAVKQAADPKPVAAAAAQPAAAADPAKAAPAKEAPGKQPAVKQAAAAAGADEDDDGDAPADGKIPYQKYQRDRKRARDQIKTLEQQLAATNEKFARGNERLRLLAEAMQPVPQQEVDQDPEPDPNTDLIAWAHWSRREQGRMREALASTHQTVHETREDTAMRENYSRDAMSFAREMPDFGGAYNHLLGSRAAMLAEQGYDKPSIERLLLQEEKGLVQRAFQAGKRPAQMIYNMARQMGWNPQSQPQTAAQPNGGGNGNGQAAHAAPANGGANGSNGNGAQPQPSVVEEIERIQRGQASAKSLSDGGGTPQELSIEAIGSMSEQEFEALYAKSKGKIDSMMGKRVH